MRLKAEAALRQILGATSMARRDRRLVGRAYANASWRLGQGLLSLPLGQRSKYSRWAGQPVVLNQAMIEWIAKGVA